MNQAIELKKKYVQARDKLRAVRKGYILLDDLGGDIPSW